MSIEKRTYTSSKTGKIHTSYRACVWSPAEGRKIHGRFHKTEKAARQDETDIQRAIDSGAVKPVSYTHLDVYKRQAPPSLRYQ